MLVYFDGLYLSEQLSLWASLLDEERFEKLSSIATAIENNQLHLLQHLAATSSISRNADYFAVSSLSGSFSHRTQPTHKTFG